MLIDHSPKLSQKHQPSRVRGQGMTEYIIVVALISIAAIATTNYFGRTIRNQVAGMAAGLAGNQRQATAAQERATTAGSAAATAAEQARGLSNFSNDVVVH